MKDSIFRQGGGVPPDAFETALQLPNGSLNLLHTLLSQVLHQNSQGLTCKLSCRALL
jgi:hypothetical protein